MREKILLDNDWKFHRGDLPKKKNLMKGAYYISAKTERMLLGPAAYLTKDDSYAFEPKEMCDENWENVDLPHDYVIEGTPSTKYPQARGYLKYENAALSICIFKRKTPSIRTSLTGSKPR